MIEGFREELVEYSERLTKYTQSKFTTDRVKPYAQRLKVLGQRKGKSGLEGYLDTLSEVANILDRLYKTRTDYSAYDNEDFLDVMHTRMSRCNYMGMIPIFKMYDEEDAYRRIEFPSNDAELRYEGVLRHYRQAFGVDSAKFEFGDRTKLADDLETDYMNRVSREIAMI